MTEMASTQMDLQTEYIDTFHSELNGLRQDESLTDITVEVDGKQFPCHKVVLSATSSYFKSMFTLNMSECKSKKVTIPLLQADVFENILDFLYTGKIVINTFTAYKLFEAANFMQMELLQKACEEFIKEHMLDIEHCLTLWNTAKKLSVRSLEDSIFQFILKNFSKLITLPEFFDLDLDDIKRVLAHEDVCLPGEDELSEAILKWLENDLEGRKPFVQDVFKLLRLSFTSGEYLFHQICEEHSELLHDHGLLPYVNEAKKYFTLPARQSELWTETTQQRPASLFEDVLMVIEGMGSESTSNCYAYSLSKKNWFQLCPLPDYRRSGIAVCAYGHSTMYVSGGKALTHSVSNKMIRYDGKTNAWSTVVYLPLKFIMHHSMTIVGKGLYIIGGYSKSTEDDQGVSSKIYCLDITTNDFKESGPLVEAVHTTTVSVCNGKILIFGGFGSFPVTQGYSTVDIVQCFDPRYGVTTVIKDMPAILGSRSVGLDDQIYIVTSNGKVLKVLLKQKTYTEIADIPKFSRGKFEINKQDQRLYLIGGSGKDGKDWHKDMMTFDLVTMEIRTESVPCKVTGALRVVIKKSFLKNQADKDLQSEVEL